jgi:4-amino-4-deoxy-L-arabinose transferase-like glycosyltransferase
MAESAASRVDAAFRIAASLVGTLPAAVLCAICLARLLPIDEETRFAIGFTLAIPIWVTAMCLAFLARDGRRAWIWCVGLTLVLGALALGVPR